MIVQSWIDSHKKNSQFIVGEIMIFFPVNVPIASAAVPSSMRDADIT